MGPHEGARSKQCGCCDEFRLEPEKRAAAGRGTDVIADVSTDELRHALERFDREERGRGEWSGWEQKQNFKFAIDHEGRRYPVKRIIEIATGAPVGTFSGGDEANGFVRGRGFEVVELERSDLHGTSLRASIETVLGGYAGAKGSGPCTKASGMWAVFDQLASALRRTPLIAANDELLVEPSVGKGQWAKVPWVAILDRSETTTVQRGIYVVYLFREDMSGVYLTLNQGVTEPTSKLGDKKGRRGAQRTRRRNTTENLCCTPQGLFRGSGV